MDQGEFLKAEFWRWVKEHDGKIPQREDMRIRDGYPNNKAYTSYLGVSDRQWQAVLDFVGAKRQPYQPKGKYDDMSREDVIEYIKQVTARLGKTPTQTDFRGRGKVISSSTILNKLGLSKWNDVLDLCGIEPIKRKDYTEEEALSNLKSLCEQLGRSPQQAECPKYKLRPSYGWFVSRFGTFDAALNAVGYKRELSNDDLIQLLRDFYNTRGRSPVQSDMGNANGMPSSALYFKRFNMTWNEILNSIGLPVTHIVNNDENEALERLKSHYVELGRIPTKEDFQFHNWLPGQAWYTNKYGSYAIACYKAGIGECPLTDQERIDISLLSLKELASKLGRCPTVAEYDSYEHKGFQRRVLENKLGIKYNNICRNHLPQYALNINFDITKEEILEALTSIRDKLGRSPMFNELKQLGFSYTHKVIDRLFGCGYNDLLRSLGWEVTGSNAKKRTEEEMLDDFNNTFKSLGRIPYVNEFGGDSTSYVTYIKYFGSIRNVCEALDIDYDMYYIGGGAGKICCDNKGELCKSIPERDITNFLIENEVAYEKETPYSDILPDEIAGQRRFDWKVIDSNLNVYYIEYFGMYNSRGHIGRRYVKKARKKIRDIYKNGMYNNCIFLFPRDIKEKSMSDLLSKVI